MTGRLTENTVLTLLERIQNEPASIHQLVCKTGIDHRTIKKYIYLITQIQNSPRVRLETVGMRVLVRKEKEIGSSRTEMPPANLHRPERGTFNQGDCVDKTAQSPIEQRLDFLEKRVAMLEAQKTTANTAKSDNVLSLVGLAFLLRHIHEKITSSPQAGDYDSYLKGIFKTEITPQNRLEYAEKLRKLSLSLLDDATEALKKRKT